MMRKFNQLSLGGAGTSIVLFLIGLFFLGLIAWERYGPVTTRDHNRLEAARISPDQPDEFTFAVFGDHKGNRSVFDPLIEQINVDRQISFAIDTGDMVPRGSREAYRRFVGEIAEDLHIPLLSVIGNHDLEGDSTNYRQFLGPTYYSFRVGGGYFIVLESISESQFDQDQFEWLEEELRTSQASAYRFIFMHVPPFDPRGGDFQKCLPEKDRNRLMGLFRRYQVTHLFASHIHGYFSGVREGVPYTITGGAGARLQGKDTDHFFHHFVRVHVADGKAEIDVIRIAEEESWFALADYVEDHYESFLPFIGIFLLALSGVHLTLTFQKNAEYGHG